ncbi:DLW-39 family protein [Schaalia cardiffensis]|nr:DLW-39 family protein [Schaalia cardiffensis]
MRKWITALSAVTAAVAVGVVIRQIFEDLSDNVELWKSVTDEPYED